MSDASAGADPLRRMRVAAWLAGADLEAVVARLHEHLRAWPLLQTVSRPPAMVGPFMTSTPGRARPDVFVWREGEKWLVRSNWEGIPWFLVDGRKVVFDAAAHRVLEGDGWVERHGDTGAERTPEERAQLDEAAFFLRALLTRGQTVEALARALVERAPEFFLRRTEGKPFSVQEITRLSGVPEPAALAALRSMRLRCAHGDYKLGRFFRAKELQEA